MPPSRRRALAALLSCLALLTGCAEPPASAALVHTEPLPIASAAGEAPEGDHPNDQMARGLRAYGRGDWAGCVRELERARSGLTGFKQVMTQLYLGSALRLQGRHGRALEPLHLVIEEGRRAMDPEILDMALFERAQADLALDRRLHARNALREVIGLRRAHASTAARQLEQLDALHPPGLDGD